MILASNYYKKDCYWAHMITFRCNGGCKYCINLARGCMARYPEMSGAQMVEFWNSIENHEGKALSIIGGEPTLHKDFEEMVAGMSGYDVTVTSNLATKFYEDPNFPSYLRSKSPLRMNTTFHPSAPVTPALFAERIFMMRDSGINVGQVAMVKPPNDFDITKWKDEFASAGLNVDEVTFLGFWTEGNGYFNDSDMKPDNLWPKDDIDMHLLTKVCGIDSLEHYRAQCGMPQDSVVEWSCNNGMKTLLVAPDGTVHECHYKLYQNVDGVGNVLTGDWEHQTKPRQCMHFGKCIGCDVPRTSGLDWRKHNVIDPGGHE